MYLRKIKTKVVRRKILSTCKQFSIHLQHGTSRRPAVSSLIMFVSATITYAPAKYLKLILSIVNATVGTTHTKPYPLI